MRKNDMINFDDEDFEEYSNEIQELNNLCKEILSDKDIKKKMRKYKYLKKPFHKFVDFVDLIIDYGFFKTVTGKYKEEEEEDDFYNWR